MKRSCAVCGKSYEAQRSTKKYCGGTCRTAASRAGGAAPRAVRVASVPGVASVGLVSAALRELTDADRLDTTFGQAALELARRIASEEFVQSGASVASMVKQLRETMADALKGAAVVADGLDELRDRRDLKRSAG